MRSAGRGRRERLGARPAEAAATGGGASQTHVALAGAALVAGVLLGVAARGAGPLPGDLALTRALQRLPPDGAPGAVLGSVAGVVRLLPIVALVVALAGRRWAAALLILLAGAGSLLIGDGLLKPLAVRPRPSAELVRVLEPHGAGDYGFPSSTTMLACASLGLIAYFAWRARARLARPVAAVALIVAPLLIVATGLSRLYVGAHWATDVLGSWLFGTAWLLALLALHRWWLAGRAGARPDPRPPAAPPGRPRSLP